MSRGSFVVDSPQSVLNRPGFASVLSIEKDPAAVQALTAMR